ncbi:MAG: YdcF family protein [Bacteroidia bacterium]|nr:YdcF family protein [Bacteroidia bacterium]
MFYLSKIAAIFFKPLIWILILLFFIWRVKNAKKKKYLIGVWIVFTLFLTNIFIVNKFVERYEIPFHPIAKGKIYDCAIVLGGASAYDSFSQRLQFNESAERITEPVLLYKNKKVRKLLFTGGSASVFPPYEKEAKYVRKFWIEMGIDTNDIIIETESRNTAENAKFVKKILDQHPQFKKILLITSALHLPRSKHVFMQNGIQCDSYPVDFIVRRYDKQIKIKDYIIPNSKALILWENLIHEWIGLLLAKI